LELFVCQITNITIKTQSFTTILLFSRHLLSLYFPDTKKAPLGGINFIWYLRELSWQDWWLTYWRWLT